VVTSARDSDGDLKLIVWNVSAAGAFSRRGDSGDQAGEATLILSIADSFDHVVASVRTAEDTLKLIAWEVSADGLTMHRLADSDNLAGETEDNALLISQ
jgi:hypothetical protein